ncbi:MAG: tRNA glutamyl-Q(34) synthetase GluQRS [Gammaproteobacteria bacterium]|nr:tRNA glutamyl-Q(34) synthetase GluQRS [Gammaproteobacteria bacterium]
MTTGESDSPGRYIGRFAPSPTGPLHLGSLVAALASFLDARAAGGVWLLRMEDLDPPREPPGAADEILRQLEELGMTWDGAVLYQSARIDAYEEILRNLEDRELCYPCDCSRRQVRAMGPVYDGRCRSRAWAHESTPAGTYAVRLLTEPEVWGIDDRIQGRYEQNLERDTGDFVVRRRDGLFAYQLAVVADDAFQGINRIVRGIDLLDSTPRQLYLQSLLGYPRPGYAHFPVLLNEQGQKLSKQHLAAPVDTRQPAPLLRRALCFLNHPPPADLAGPGELLDWAVGNWDILRIPALHGIPASRYERAVTR